MYQFLTTPSTENKTIIYAKSFPKIILIQFKLTPIKSKKQYKAMKSTIFYHKQQRYQIFEGDPKSKSQEITPYCSPIQPYLTLYLDGGLSWLFGLTLYGCYCLV